MMMPLTFRTEEGQAASGQIPSSAVDCYCNTGDSVCERHSFVITPAHLQYASVVPDAANFIILIAQPPMQRFTPASS